MIDASYPDLRADRVQVTRAALARSFADQRFDVVTARRVLGPAWDARLAAVLFDLHFGTAAAVGTRVAAELPGDFDPDVMAEWLRVNAGFGAASINDSTREALDAAEDDAAIEGVFDALEDTGAAGYAVAMVTMAANFGAVDAARSAGGESKTWTGGTTRHGAMNGETVGIGEDFSNGMPWPGSPSGGAAEVANCGCSVIFN